MTTVVTGATGFLGSALVTKLVYEISRTRFELDSAPKVGVEEGMKLTAVGYYKHRYMINSSRNRRAV